jgi:hypothetical protein
MFILSQAVDDPAFNPKYEWNGRTYAHFAAECDLSKIMKKLFQLGSQISSINFSLSDKSGLF